MRSTTRQSAEQAKREDLTSKVFEFRKLGFDFRTIANNLGISPSTAHKYFNTEIKRIQKENGDTAKQYQALQLRRLETILRPAMTEAVKGNLKAVEASRRVLDSISRLTGADAPTKIAPTTPDGEESVGGIVVVPATAGSVDEWLKEFGPKG
ncbi:hypothetical protein [Shewanella sp.]|uniref:hypothetical protein n=1 Tax=Shewanella sp. TaxID=50422 RepID=UPI003F39EEAE